MPESQLGVETTEFVNVTCNYGHIVEAFSIISD